MGKLISLILVGLILWFIPWVFVFSLGGVVYFPYAEDGRNRYARLTGPLVADIGIDKDWAYESEIPLTCRAAVVVAEDGKFLEHSGIDRESIEKAIKRNKKSKIARGGSTITQQLVKNVFLYRDKTYIRKTREIIGALILDIIMSKGDQLVWYLNVVEFGPRIYGIKSAAKYFFRKEPKRLTLTECASLVALLRDPVKSSRWLKAQTLPEYLRRRQQNIMSAVISSGILQKLKAL